jgi:hypothetical protein
MSCSWIKCCHARLFCPPHGMSITEMMSCTKEIIYSEVAAHEDRRVRLKPASPRIGFRCLWVVVWAKGKRRLRGNQCSLSAQSSFINCNCHTSSCYLTLKLMIFKVN